VIIQDVDLDNMTAEELLAEMARPDNSPACKESLRERLVIMHQRLVVELAGRYRYRGEPMDDLRQAAYVGLMKAIHGFDADLGHDFRGYACVTILGEVKRHFRDRTWAIRVPRVHQERRAELNKTAALLAQDLGRSPTLADLAVRMGISQEDLLLTIDASSAYSTLSLDVPFGDDDDSVRLMDRIGHDDGSLSAVVDQQAVKPLIDALPWREKNILLMRFYGNMTQADIAAEIGISQMHVSRIIRAILDDLRHQLTG